MRSYVASLALGVSLVVSGVSLIGNEVVATPNGQAEGCCVCSGCSTQNSTAATSGTAAGSTSCFGAPSEQVCADIAMNTTCTSCSFENATCNDPSLAEACGDPNVMAPAASPGLLVALAAVLAGFGAFYLRRRHA